MRRLTPGRRESLSCYAMTATTQISSPCVIRPYSRIAAIYDAAAGIRDFIRARNAFEALVRWYGITFDSALDVGCGTGLFACYLGRCWGVPVFGVDSSPEMLRVAACNCRSPNVRFLLEDIRCLRLPCQVDLATANTFTLNHFLGVRELALVLRRINENLRPGGHLIFDMLTHRQPRPYPPALIRRVLRSGQELLQQIRWDPLRRLLSILIVHRSENGLPPALEVHVGRGYSPLQLSRCLRDAGFLIRGIHDADTLRMAAGCPARVILVARKQRARE